MRLRDRMLNLKLLFFCYYYQVVPNIDPLKQYYEESSKLLISKRAWMQSVFSEIENLLASSTSRDEEKAKVSNTPLTPLISLLFICINIIQI